MDRFQTKPPTRIDLTGPPRGPRPLVRTPPRQGRPPASEALPVVRRTVAIWGGCATRDAFALPSRQDELAERLPLVFYGARSSWISQASRAPSWSETALDGGLGNFGQRVVREDLAKTLVPHLIEHRPDLVILDLIVERLRLVRSERSWVTSSEYFEASSVGRRALARGDRLLGMTDARRLRLFQRAVRRLAATLTEQLPDTVFVLNQAPYSTRLLGGASLPEPQASWARELNAAQEPMFDVLAQEFGPRLVRAVPPPEVTLVDPHHRWGLASYHYAPLYYHWLLDTLLALPTNPATAPAPQVPRPRTPGLPTINLRLPLPSSRQR